MGGKLYAATKGDRGRGRGKESSTVDLEVDTNYDTKPKIMLPDE